MKSFIMGVMLSLLAFSALADVTSVEATVDKNPVMVDEAIRLTVVANGDASNDAFNSSALLGDFVVGRTSVSTQTSIVNFDARQTTTWTTTLFPRKTGTFTIPSLTIEGKQTKPIEIRVIPVQQGSNQTARDYYVTTEVDTGKVYLHQQIHYVVKLFLATAIERGSLQAPELKNARIQQIGDDKQYSDIVNGKRYQVIERHFAIVPQKSGEFTIRGPVFSGEVMAANTNQRFGFFNRTREVSRVGPDVTIDVQPVPADIDYHWLPSEFVRLDEEWPQQQEFTVGEPVTRTMTLTAMGVVEEQLPELPQLYPPDFKQYPDQASTATVQKDNTLIAQRVESVALIPTKPGKFVLPDIRVPWFNVLTGETEYATLPARTITVAPAAGSAPSNKAENAKLIPPEADEKPVASQPEQPQNETNAVSAPQGLTINWLTWLFAGLWIITLIAWLLTWRKMKNQPAEPASKATVKKGSYSEKAAFDALLTKVEKGGSGAILLALNSWLHQLYPHDKNQTIRPADHVSTAKLQGQVDSLLASQYSQQDTTWDKAAFRQTLKDARQQWLSENKKTQSALSPLYRQAR